MRIFVVIFGFVVLGVVAASEENEINEEMRSIHKGFDPQAQAIRDKREMETRGWKRCPKCPLAKMPKRVCYHGYKPKLIERQGHCTCVTKYTCCGKCHPPVDPHCTPHESYPIKNYDCCNCLEKICKKCPKYILRKPNPGEHETERVRFFYCQNPCDKPVKRFDRRGCPIYVCEREPEPVPEPVTCNPNCMHKETIMDKCGNHREICRCIAFPRCFPKRPPHKECHVIKRRKLHYWGCNRRKNQCFPCFEYNYEFQAQQGPNINKQCRPCESRNFKPLKCGAYEVTCDCKKKNLKECFPEKPTPLPCHKVVSRLQAVDNSICDHTTGDCKRCIMWVQKPLQIGPIIPQKCDSRCMYLAPDPHKCGGPKCKCIFKSRRSCFPKPPSVSSCYRLVRTPVDRSFMCQIKYRHGRRRPKCVQCIYWKYFKKPCAVGLIKRCSSRCHKLVRIHVGCGCYKTVCRRMVVPRCQVPKPPPNNCFSKPVKKVHPGVYSWNSLTSRCELCYEWEQHPIKVPPRDDCKLKSLPSICYDEWNNKGECNERVTDCRPRNDHCTEIYPGPPSSKICPDGYTVVMLKSRCGKDRNACADCSKIARVPRYPSNFPRKCFRFYHINILSHCKILAWTWRRCNPRFVNLRPCRHGYRKEVYKDPCGCPRTRCKRASCDRPCPKIYDPVCDRDGKEYSNKCTFSIAKCKNPSLRLKPCPQKCKTDFQIVLDSSSSIGQRNWRVVISGLKAVYRGRKTNARYGVAKYGLYVKIIQRLRGVISFGLPGFKYEGMFATGTGRALAELIQSYKRRMRKSANRCVVLVTGGISESIEEVNDAISQWQHINAKVHIIHYGHFAVYQLDQYQVPRHQKYLLKHVREVKRALEHVRRKCCKKYRG